MSAPPPSELVEGRDPFLSVIAWWAVTVVVVVVLDDLTFGPLFWLISRTAGPLAGLAAAYAIYVPAQIYIVRAGTAERPGRVAAFFIRRFDLQRRNPRIQRNESLLRNRVVGGGSAVLLCLVIGGALPPLLLWRQGFDRRFVRRVSVVTAVVYSTEFALLHGVLPSTF